jgi:UDP-N-acetylmuramyl pentapeptide synthase
MTAAGATEGGMASDSILFLSDKENGMLLLKKCLKKGDWILVKGSRGHGMNMDRIAAQICEDFGRDKDSEENKTDY